MKKILTTLTTTVDSNYITLQHNVDTYNFNIDKTISNKEIFSNISLISKQNNNNNNTYEHIGRIILDIYRPCRFDQNLGNFLNNVKSNELDLYKYQHLKYNVNLNKSNFPSHIGFQWQDPYIGVNKKNYNNFWEFISEPWTKKLIKGNFDFTELDLSVNLSDSSNTRTSNYISELPEHSNFFDNFLNTNVSLSMYNLISIIILLALIFFIVGYCTRFLINKAGNSTSDNDYENSTYNYKNTSNYNESQEQSIKTNNISSSNSGNNGNNEDDKENNPDPEKLLVERFDQETITILRSLFRLRNEIHIIQRIPENQLRNRLTIRDVDVLTYNNDLVNAIDASMVLVNNNDNQTLSLFNNNLRRLLVENPNFNLLDLYDVVNNENWGRYLSLYEYINFLSFAIENMIEEIVDDEDWLETYYLADFPEHYDYNDDEEL